MIWKPAYRTLVARDVPVPALEFEADLLVGGFDMAAFRDMAIWRRLVAADAPDVRYLEAIFLSEPQPTDQELLQSIIPPSLLPHTLLIADPGDVWRDLIQPVQKYECFAAVLRGSMAPIVMKGIPTEEAWDAFLEAVRG